MILVYLVGAALFLSAQMTGKDAVELATRTLAQELQVEEGDLEVVRAVPVRWPDGSLGCPGKGQLYVQVIIPGYRVDLKKAEQVYRVHVGNGRAVRCQEDVTRLRVPARDAEPIGRPSLTQLAREDLAARLDVDVDEIRVTFVESVTWHDASLGCPEEGETYEKVETAGSIIGLTHAGRTYEYHADKTRPVLCEGRYTR